MLDDRVRSVLERLELEDEDERTRGLPPSERSRAVARTTGQFLFALVAPQTDCEVLEIGGSRGYSTIWLAAGVRYLGGRVLSLESDPEKVRAWRRNLAEAGVEEWGGLIEGGALAVLPAIDEVVREWRFPVRAVEVPAGRGASPGPTGNRRASVGDDALRAARLSGRGRKRLY